MDIKELKKKWDYLGTEDPLWAILTDDSKKGNQWNEEEFFETGRRGAKAFLDLASHLRPGFPKRSALDFGCGVGRLTQGLAPFFERVTGVDISEAMIRKAAEYHRDNPSLGFVLNSEPNLQVFEDASFDFLLSHIVLQHVPAPLHEGFLKEFVRVLSPGGVAVFQIPQPFSDDWGSREFKPEEGGKIDMYGSPQESVLGWVQDAGARILQVVEDGACGPDHTSYRYVICRCD